MATFIAAALLIAAGPSVAGASGTAANDRENRWKIAAEAQPEIARRGIRLPVISYTAPDGSLKNKRGIVAGMRVAPNASIGLGLFETLPKKGKAITSPEDPMERKQRRSRKAAIGLALRF